MAKSTPWVWALILGLVLLNLALWDRACGLSDKYKLARDDYNELRAATDADHALAVGHIAELNNAIVSADATIVNLEKVITQKNKDITLLSARLAEIVGQEPPTTPEIEAMPIVVSLRAQVGTLTRMYSISVDIINEKDRVIDLWSKKFDAQVTISETFKQMYDKEHALRLASEGLFKIAEHKLKMSNAWSTVKTVAIGAAAIVVASTFIKK